MKVGAERNKLILLAVVTVILLVTVYLQFFASSTPAPRPAPVAPRQAANTRPDSRTRAVRKAPSVRGQRFQPRFAGDSEDLDPMTVDPTLRTDLLANVRNVEFAGVQRNIFQFGERKKIVPPPEPQVVAKAQERLETLSKPAPAPPPEPVKPAAPPIQFKYYGFANRPGDERKRAFLLDGEDILIGGEGDIIKSRYKIIRIGVNSIVVEDMQYSNQQTLRLQEQG